MVDLMSRGEPRVRGESVLTLIEIEQTPAELFIISQFFAGVTSRCHLELELLWSFGRRVFKLCVKLQQSAAELLTI